MYTDEVHSMEYPSIELISTIFLKNKDSKITLESYEKEMRTGLLLSDGTYVKKYENGGTYFQIAQSVKFAPFLFHVFEIQAQAGLCNILTPSLKKVKNKPYQYYSYTTKTFKEWNTEKNLWYSKYNGKKILPKNIHDLITPIALAYWIMGDGGRTGNGLHLATPSFSSLL